MTFRSSILGALLPVLIAVAVLGAGCQNSGSDPGAGAAGPIFGNGYADPSPVLARVGDVRITQRDLDLRFAELSPQAKRRFTGEGWQTRFLRYMVDEVLQHQEALALRLDRDPQIAQALITTRRMLLKDALQERHVFAGKAPSEQDIRSHYERNKERFREQGFMRARHIVCANRDAAFQAYDAVRSGKLQFPQAVAMYTTNLESAQQAGDLGWFLHGGHIPALVNGIEFSRAIWGWPAGLHEPAEIEGEWHVVEILERSEDRDLPLEMVRAQVLEDLRPMVEEEAMQTYLRQLRRSAKVEYQGAYRPGGGLSPQQLLERAWFATVPQQKLDILGLVVDDYPDHELADDALFLIATIQLEGRHDTRLADLALTRLIKEYPHSDLYGHAQYILENMNRADFVNPVKADELRRRSIGKS